MNNAASHVQTCDAHPVQFHDRVPRANCRFCGMRRYQEFVRAVGKVSNAYSTQCGDGGIFRRGKVRRPSNRSLLVLDVCDSAYDITKINQCTSGSRSWNNSSNHGRLTHAIANIISDVVCAIPLCTSANNHFPGCAGAKAHRIPKSCSSTLWPVGGEGS